MGSIDRGRDSCEFEWATTFVGGECVSVNFLFSVLFSVEMGRFSNFSFDEFAVVCTTLQRVTGFSV